jgi:hypothetical protein
LLLSKASASNPCPQLLVGSSSSSQLGDPGGNSSPLPTIRGGDGGFRCGTVEGDGIDGRDETEEDEDSGVSGVSGGDCSGVLFLLSSTSSGDQGSSNQLDKANEAYSSTII